MITLEANYAKKIGLPGYSSHQFSVTLRSELADVGQVQAASAKMYAELQASVDRSIRQVGYLPALEGSRTVELSPAAEAASANQQAKIQRLIEELKIPKRVVETLAQTRYGKAVSQLTKLEASGLIDDLVDHPPGKGRAR